MNTGDYANALSCLPNDSIAVRSRRLGAESSTIQSQSSGIVRLDGPHSPTSSPSRDSRSDKLHHWVSRNELLRFGNACLSKPEA